MQSPQEWGALSEELRNQSSQRLSESENTLQYSAGLCHETLHMVNLLTSDEVIKRRFLGRDILPRVAGMVLNMLRNLVGSKSLDIKVDNFDKYGFDPRKMLRDVCLTLLNFADSADFGREVVSNGYYENGLSLQKAVSTVKKYELLGDADRRKLEALLESVKSFQETFVSLSTLADECPEEFLDELLATIMRDPVKLPTSGKVVDRLTISHCLLNDPMDPFNRQPLSLNMLEPQEDLKIRIDQWLASKGYME